MAKAKKKIGKNQVDLEPIGIAIQKAQAKLKALKKLSGLTPKQKAEVAIRVAALEGLHKVANSLCCDEQWFCPCPDPKP
jgi:hypothetical protein